MPDMQVNEGRKPEPEADMPFHGNCTNVSYWLEHRVHVGITLTCRDICKFFRGETKLNDKNIVKFST